MSINSVLNLLSFLIIVGTAYGQGNILINEFVSSNINGLVDVESGEYSDWIELYNPTQNSVNISGYYLSDDFNEPAKWQFPENTIIESNAYIVIWADDNDQGLHTNFKLSSNGEQILLSSNSLTIVDSITYGKQRSDVSFGRDVTNSNSFLFFNEPTPGLVNSNDGVSTNKLSDVTLFSIESGFYNSSLAITLSAENSAEIYYSIDGSLPTKSSGIHYTNPILIDTTSVIRAIAIESGKLKSPVTANTYFINVQTELPVMSVTTDPKNLWDDEIGIYTIGTNGIPMWNVTANYWQDWERPATVEFYEDDKQEAFEIDGGIAINGARRNMLQKSMRIFARKKYGDPVIVHKIFPDKEIRNFSSIILRNGGYAEFRKTLIRDGLIRKIAADNMDLETQGYRPCALYINGVYWGIYNIREKQNEEYLKANRNVDPDNLDILEKNLYVVEGSKDHYENMLNFISDNDLSIQENYDSVAQWMEIDNFINYQIIQQYISNTDWPANNIKYWRPKTPEGKWRWLLFDVDAGMGYWEGSDFNSITFATDSNSTLWNNKPWSTFLLRSLLKNQNFEDEFVQRYAANISYSFNSSELISLTESFKSTIENEIPNHIDRWLPGCSTSNPGSYDGCVFASVTEWNENVEVINQFSQERPSYVYTHLMDYFNIADTIKFTVNCQNGSAGTVNINQVRARYQRAATLFKNKKLKLEAKPNIGFKFVEWKGDFTGNDAVVEIIPSENMEIEAVFVATGVNTIPSVISTDYTVTSQNSPYTVQDNIYIYENATLTIEAGTQIKIPKNGNIFIYGALEVAGTSENPVSFSSLQSGQRWGALNFTNAKLKSKINYLNLSGCSNGPDLLNQVGGISSYNSDISINNLNMDNVQFPIFIQYGNVEMRNSVIHTEVTCDLINVKYADFAIVENCEFIGSDAIDTDAIDYDDVKTGIIRRNKIYDFIGSNSDAIDVGEGAKNVLVEENLIYNCSDKGVSIGQASSAIVRGNVFVSCNQAIGIKDEGSYGLVDHNTFYNNTFGVACFEKTLGRGGGKADITNSIFSQSTDSDLFQDAHSEITINYSLTDGEMFTGVGNLQGDPEFIYPDTMNFRPGVNSPAIDSGDPNYPLDPDGSRTDMGASYFDFDNSTNIVINEINYNSNAGFDAEDWIELLNPNEEAVDLSSWIFKDSDDDNLFVFPVGSILESGAYMVLCRDSAAFNSLYSTESKVIGNFNFGLSNAGEHIRLFNNFGNIVDSLTYDDKYPWPVDADGNGYTLQLNGFENDNSNAENWMANYLYGTPGKLNILTDTTNPEDKLPTDFALYQNYPNPFNPSTTIKFNVPKESDVILKVYDILGREIKTLIDDRRVAGKYTVVFSNTGLSSGVYFYQLVADDFQKTLKMVLLK